MNRLLSLTLLILLSGSAIAFAGTPAIFYSDLTSGPRTGGKDNLGVIVTITGKNFGASRGAGTVSVGGGQAGAYLLWTDTKIAFQPGSNAQTGSITVTTGEGTSNGIPFAVRAGNIYFVDDTSPGSTGTGTYADPWRSPRSFYTAMKAGDTCYFRGGTYTGSYGADTSASFSFQSAAPSGTLNNEIAFIGYPGERAHFQHTRNFFFGYPKNYYVIAELSLYGTSKAMNTDGTNIRAVNNKMEGLKTHAYGIIHPLGGSNHKIYGNELFGATSGDKADHPIYVGYGADHIDIGWNHFHSNNVAQGPVISINTDYAQTNHYKFENIRIHDNVIDCRGSSGLRGIGIVATDTGSSVYIYNNTFIEPQGSAVYQYSASAYIYNNVFFNASGSSAILLNTVDDAGNYYRPETVDIKNNAFFNKSGIGYISVSNESLMGKVSVDYNAYYGNGAGPSRDTHAVNADPLFVNRTGYDFHLAQNSPLINKGCAPMPLALFDRDGVPRPQGAGTDIGSYEYAAAGAVQPPPVTTSVSGTVRDSAGSPVSGTTIQLSGSAAASVTSGTDGSYAFSGLPYNGNFTLAPSKSGWTFAPASLALTGVAAPRTNQDFTASSSAPSPAAYAISGTIRDHAGEPVSGITVTLSGGASRTATTAADGTYSFTSLPANASYTMTPSAPGYRLAPLSSSVTSLTGNLTGRDFDATALYPVYGYVVSNSSTGVSGVTVRLTGSESRTVTSGSDGYFEFIDVAAGGQYTVAPSLTGWEFAPASMFTGTLVGRFGAVRFWGDRRYTVSGYVRDGAGQGVGYATVAISGTGVNRTALTAGDGWYEFSALPSGAACTLTVSRTGWQFTPSSIGLPALSADVTGRNFTGTAELPAYTLSGHIRSATGQGIGGATVTIAGGTLRTTVSAADGYYQFTGVTSGSDYSLSVARDGWALAPQAIAINTLSGDRSQLDFSGYRLYSIGGIVRDLKGDPVAGVTVALSGGENRSAASGTDGSFLFSGLPEGRPYTVAASLAGWVFDPVSQATGALTASVSDLAFTGRRVFRIRGYIRDFRGAPIKNVEVILSGTQNGSYRTGDDGYYEFAGLTEGTEYTVRPERVAYVFAPELKSISAISGDIEDWHFQGTFQNPAPRKGEMKIIGSSSGRGTINPDRGESSSIFFQGDGPGTYVCHIFTASGELVWSACMDNVQEGTFEWVPRQVASGIYNVHVKGPGVNLYRKIAVLR